MKVLIIGAGSAGISAAKFLGEKGQHDVTLIEKSDRPGGRCTSIQKEEGWHELATSYVAWGFHTFQRWMNQHRISIYRIKQPGMVLGQEQKSIIPLREYALGGSSLRHKIRGFRQLVKFECLWFRFFFHELKGSKDKQINQQLSRPFEQWLDEHQLDVIKRMSHRAITSAGYGYLESIPTIHCLRWLKPSVMLSGLLGLIWEPVPGFENIWKLLSWEFDIRYEQDVVAIETKEKVVTIRTSTGQVYTADQVIVALPMSQAKHFFAPASKQALICAQMLSHVYTTILFQCKDRLFESDDQEAVGFAHNLSEDSPGKVMVIRRTGEKTATMMARKNDRSQYYVSYQYRKGLPDETLVDYLKEEVKTLGTEVTVVSEIRHFNYMQTYQKDAIKAGLVRDIDSLQGVDQVWFSSASISFESVENIVDANEELIHRMLKGQRGLYWLKFSRLFKSFIHIRYWLFAQKRR